MKTNLTSPSTRHPFTRPVRLLLVAAVAALTITAARAQIVVPSFKLDTPLWYIHVGVVVNPVPTNYLLLPPGAGFWCTPAEMIFDGTTVTARDFADCPSTNGPTRTRHNTGPHVDDEPQGSPWAFDISCSMPTPFGARETRVRGMTNHPANHRDEYEAVVGAMNGTMPGLSLAPRSVILHGSIGKHMSGPAVKGNSRLEPPSRVPSVPNQDYPTGQLLYIADTDTSEALMVLVLNSVSQAQVGSVVLRRGQSSLMDLRSLMQIQQIDTEIVALSLQSVALPTLVVDALKSGEAFIEVQTAAHPDGKIVGAISSDAQPTASIALQNGNAVVTRNGPGYLQLASQLGPHGTQFTSFNPLTQPIATGCRFFTALNLPGWDFDGDGQDDLTRTPDGLGYDTGGGDFVEIAAKNWVIDVKPNGFDVKVYDANGNLVKTYELRDNNGDGDFGESGEVNVVTP